MNMVKFTLDLVQNYHAGNNDSNFELIHLFKPVTQGEVLIQCDINFADCNAITIS